MESTEYILYAVSKDELADIDQPETLMLCEIWRERPPLNFVDQKNEDRTAWLAEDKQHYVWISPDAVLALKDECVPIAAFGTRSDESMDFSIVIPRPTGLQFAEFREQAKIYNEEQLRRARARQKPKTEAQ